ncbi:solute carrier family 22 member 13-like [Patiria miniata]|uniref:Major facilitator superfamily (MFS) profile domain-containing protein n=1 Tax=Patiria miniata TaxID=46514 RepID=A0A914A847_PATMI|nr:solute carrier family 22 member 13-like [Patiria miniata]
MKFDEVLEILGGFGRYQWYAFFFLNLVNFLGAFTTLQHAFYAGESDHWCKTFEPINCTAFGYKTAENCTAAVKAVAIPPSDRYPDPDKYFYENCLQWDLPEDLKFSPDINHTHYDAAKVPCKKGWEFDHSQFRTTIIEDWQLVCNDAGETNIMTAVFFGGFMAGSFIFGVFSDWFGRKKALMVSMVIWFLGALATPFTSAPWNYYIVRFVTGTGQLGRWVSGYVLLNEFVGAEWRIVAGVLIGVTYSFGYMTVALVAMAIRSWRALAFIPIIPLFLSLFAVIPLTESSRWLLTKGRVREAEEVIRKVGRWNKKDQKLPDVIFDEKEVHDFKEVSKGHVPSFYDLYLTPNMCFRTIILQYNWMTNSMVYYGLAFSTQELGFDTYWTFFLFGAVEIPALIYATIGVRVIGRKINMIGLELIGGVACLATIFLEDPIARTVVAMIGKFCITASFNIIYLWTSEMYPTPVRSATVGLCSVTARVGSIVAPFIFNLAKLDNVTNDLHLIVFGAAAVVAGVLLIPLPETKGRDLPDTMREGEEFGKLNFMKRWRWGRDRYEDTEALNVDLNMDVYGREVLNPAYVPDKDDYAYTARSPPPYEAVNEKGSQFPEKPRQKREKKDQVVGENGPQPGVEVLVGTAAVQGSLPEKLGESESFPQVEEKGIADGVVPGSEASQGGGDTPSGEGGETGDGNDRSGLLAGGSGDRASASSDDDDGDKASDGGEKASDHGGSDTKGGESGESNEIGDDVERGDGDSSTGSNKVTDGGDKAVDSDEKGGDSDVGASGGDGDKASDGGDKTSDGGDKTSVGDDKHVDGGDRADSSDYDGDKSSGGDKARVEASGIDNGDKSGESDDKGESSGERDTSDHNADDADGDNSDGRSDSDDKDDEGGDKASSHSGEGGHDGDGDRASGSGAESHSGSDTSTSVREYDMADIDIDNDDM